MMKRVLIISIALMLVITFWMVYSVEREVIMASVTQGPVQEYLQLDGNVKLEHYQALYSPFEGIVKLLRIGEGGIVMPGQELIQLEVVDWEGHLKRAQTVYQEACANLKALQGQEEPEELKMARMQLEQAQAAADMAANEYQYQSELLRQYTVENSSDTVLREQEMAVQIATDALQEAKSQCKAAQVNFDLIKQGLSTPDIQKAEAEKEAALNELNKIRKTKGLASLSMNINGVLINQKVSIGSKVFSGEILMEAGTPRTAYIKARITADKVGQCKLGQEVLISGPVLSNNVIHGTVSYVGSVDGEGSLLDTPNPSTNSAKQTQEALASTTEEAKWVEVRVNYDVIHYILKPDSLVKVKLVTMAVDRTVAIPKGAVFNHNGRSCVYVVENSKAYLRGIEIGMKNEEVIEVKRGLIAGEQVIVEPGLGIASGTKVVQRTGL